MKESVLWQHLFDLCLLPDNSTLKNGKLVVTKDILEHVVSSGHHAPILRRLKCLITTDLATLVTREQKICFYGNLMNVMVIHMWLFVVQREMEKVSFGGVEFGLMKA